MRILFGFVGNAGHFQPLVPIARAAQTAGHSVAFTCEPWMVSMVEAGGFTALAEDLEGDGPQRLPLVPVDMDREYRGLREHFARRRARERAAHTVTCCAEWKPDLVVCDEVDFGSMIAAEFLQLPYASVLVLATGSFLRPLTVAEPLNEIRAEYGLPDDPSLEMLSRFLVLSPFPPGYRDPSFPLPPTAHLYRAHSVAQRHCGPRPVWLTGGHGSKLVYVTLGTVYNLESGDLFDRILAGARELSASVLVTVGAGIEPAAFGPQPDHIRIERYIPQSEILPWCDAVISHGGSGTVLGALSHGLPMVLIPMGADGPLNAARCEELGVARVLDAIESTPQSIQDAVACVLDAPVYRLAAGRMKAEIDSLPDPSHAVRMLERLVAEGRPILLE